MLSSLLCRLSSSRRQRLLFVTGRGTLTVGASLAVDHAGSAVVAFGLNCSAACWILPDQGSNQNLLHWQADSLPLSQQGCLKFILLTSFRWCWCEWSKNQALRATAFFGGGGRWVVRNRKEVKVIDIEKVRIMRGLGHQSSIKAQCAHGVLGEHVL